MRQPAGQQLAAAASCGVAAEVGPAEAAKKETHMEGMARFQVSQQGNMGVHCSRLVRKGKLNSPNIVVQLTSPGAGRTRPASVYICCTAWLSPSYSALWKMWLSSGSSSHSGLPFSTDRYNSRLNSSCTVNSNVGQVVGEPRCDFAASDNQGAPSARYNSRLNSSRNSTSIQMFSSCLITV